MSSTRAHHMLKHLSSQHARPHPHRAPLPSTSGAFGLPALLAVSGASMSELADFVTASSVLAPTVKFAVAFPLAYHWLGGVRHMYWDTIRGFEIEEVNKSSYAIIAAAVALSLVAAGTTVKRDPARK